MGRATVRLSKRGEAGSPIARPFAGLWQSKSKSKMRNNRILCLALGLAGSLLAMIMVFQLFNGPKIGFEKITSIQRMEIINISLVHPVPPENLWIELFEKNTLVSVYKLIVKVRTFINYIIIYIYIILSIKLKSFNNCWENTMHPCIYNYSRL